MRGFCLAGVSALLLLAAAAIHPATATANEASPDTIRAAIMRRLAIPGNVLRTAPEAWAGKAAALANALAHGGGVTHSADPQAVSRAAVEAAIAEAAGKATAAKMAAAVRPTGKEATVADEPGAGAGAGAAAASPGDTPLSASSPRPPPPPTIAFWGAGGLIIFYAGVVQGLQDAGVLTPDTVYAGLSSGGLTAVLTALGMSGRDQVALAAQTVGGCGRACLGAGGLGGAVQAKLEEVLTAEAAAKLGGRVHVWATEMDPTDAAGQRGRARDLAPFTSAADLAGATTASITIPCFVTNATSTIFRGRPYMDGGMSTPFWDEAAQDGLCNVGPGSGPTTCLKVSTRPGPLALGTPAACDVAPGLASFGPPYPLLPQADWAYPTQCSAYQAPPFLHAQASADICPGCRVPLGLDACAWAQLSFSPRLVTEVGRAFTAGVAEARAWAREYGYGGGREGRA